DRKRRQRFTELRVHIRFRRGEFLKKAFLQRLYLRTKFYELLVSEPTSRVGAFLIRLLPNRGDLRLGIRPHRMRQRNADQWSIESDEFMLRSRHRMKISKAKIQTPKNSGVSEVRMALHLDFWSFGVYDLFVY